MKTATGTAYAWTVTSILTITYVYAFIDRSVFGVLLETIRLDLKMTDTEVSIVGSLGFALCYTLLQLPAGRIADLFNRRNLILGGVVLWSAMTAACGWAQNFWQLLIGRMGIGLGEAALVPAAYSLICSYFPPARLARPMALFLTSSPIGAGLALICGGALLNLFTQMEPVQFGDRTVRPWQLVFLALGAIGAGVALLVALVREPSREAPTSRDEQSVGAVLSYLRGIAPFFVPFMTGTALLNLTAYGYTTWMAPLFIRSFGWAPVDAGLWLGVTGLLCGVPAPMIAASVARRLQARGDAAAILKVSSAGCLAFLVFAVALPLSGSGTVALIVSVPMSFALCVVGGVLPTALLLLAPSNMRAQISSYWLFIGNVVGIGLGPTTFALATDYVFGGPAQLPISMAVVAGTCLAGSLLCFLLCTPPFGRFAAATLAARPA